MNTETLDLETAAFAETARRAVEACAGLDLRAQATQLANHGLLSILAAEAVGGLGLPLRHTLPVLEAAGAGLLAFPLIETILTVRALERAAPGIARAIAEGTKLVTVAWRSEFDAHRADGAGSISGRIAGPSLEQADFVLVSNRDGGILIEAGSIRARNSVAPGIDIVVPEVFATVHDLAIPGLPVVETATMERLSSDAALMRAALILGSADHCLTLACDYAATRRQFGKALCANQAIRHMLARAKLQIEGVRSIVYRAAREDGDTEFLKRAAAAGALHSCPILVETAIQVYGGMGFTWDVPLHLHLRRMRTLAAQDGLGESAARVADLYLPSVEAHGVEMATRGA